MNPLILAYDEDSGERLIALMAERKLSSAAKLERAARLAGQQLEWLKPSIMAMTKQGMVAGPVVNAPIGAMAIVAANERRCVTFHMLPPPSKELSRRQFFGDLAEMMREEMRQTDNREWTGADSLGALRLAVENFGAPPTKPGRRTMDEDTTLRFIGTFVAGIESKQLDNLIAGVELIIKAQVCPVLVGLIGPRRGPGKFWSGAWPLVLPLAPYSDAVIDPL